MRVLWWIGAALVLLAMVKALAVFVVLLSIEWRNPLQDDAPMYFAAGRGLLHGRPMFLELFETKPPAAFLLAAASLLWSGTQQLANIVEVLLMCAYPLLFAWYLVRAGEWKKSQIFYCTCTLLFSLLLGIVAILHAGKLSTEIFGNVFATLFVLLYATKQPRFAAWEYVLATVAIAIALLFKEPFVLAVLLSAALLTKNLQQFVRNFLLPLFFALVLFALVLLSLNALGTYITFYLPEVYLFRVMTDSTPLVFRLTMISRLLGDFINSPVALLSLVILALFTLYPLASTLHHTKKIYYSVTAVTLAFVHSYILWWTMSSISQNGFKIPWAQPMFQLRASGSALTLAIILACLVVLWGNKALFIRTVTALAALVVCALIAGLGGFAPHQFVPIFSVYVAMFILVTRIEVRTSNGYSSRFVWPAISMLIVASAICLSGAQIREITFHAAEARAQEVIDREEVQNVDAIMDACALERYISWRTRIFWAYSVHDSYGLYYEEVHVGGPRSIPHIRTLFFTHLEQTPLVISKDRSTLNRYSDEEFVSYVDTHFTTEKPACAKDLELPTQWTMFFRRGI